MLSPVFLNENDGYVQVCVYQYNADDITYDAAETPMFYYYTNDGGETWRYDPSKDGTMKDAEVINDPWD